jgi:hypothetical protein
LTISEILLLFLCLDPLAGETIMIHVPYVGSGPYCYANAFATMFGLHSPSTAVIEFATSSPFGMQLIGGSQPFFDPYGWTPDASFEEALAALGWTSTVVEGRDSGEALSCLKVALEQGPVWIGPVEMGCLSYQPEMTGPIGADHYLIVLGINSECVVMHDPQGYPYASLPLGRFLAAWRAETLNYGKPFTMRTNFTRIRVVPEEEAIRASLPAALRWLSMEGEHKPPQGSLGNEQAAMALAGLLEEECNGDLRDHLIHFAVRVGARRLADGATCLARVGYREAAAIMAEQAQLVGSLQHPLVTGDNARAAAVLRALAPTYDQLLSTLLGRVLPTAGR